MTEQASPRRRRQVIDALRRGTVPASGLDLLAIGLDRFMPALDVDLDTAAQGGSAFKAIRGEYGAGKTFLTRYLGERALRRGFATAEVQISETQGRHHCTGWKPSTAGSPRHCPRLRIRRRPSG